MKSKFLTPAFLNKIVDCSLSLNARHEYSSRAILVLTYLSCMVKKLLDINFFFPICLLCLKNSDLVTTIHVWIVVIKIGIVMNKKSNHWRSRDKFQYKYVFCNYGSLTYSVVKCHNWQRNVSSLATSFYSLIIVDLWHTVLSNEPVDKGMSIN
jgi:hypothetical protein